MNLSDFSHLFGLLNKALLTGVSLLTLVACEITPKSFNDELSKNSDIICAAIGMDESVFDIKETDEKDWYELRLRNSSDLNLSLKNNPKQRLYTISLPGSSEHDRSRPRQYSQIELDDCKRLVKFDVLDPFSEETGVDAKRLNFSRPIYKSSKRELLFLTKQKTINSYESFFISPFTAKSFSRKVNLKSNEVSKRVDWDLVQDLNLQAYNIWEEYSKEYSHSEIRSMYFRGEISELNSLKESVRLAMESSSFYSTYNQRNISHYHPAFAQILIELFISSYVESDEEYEENDEKFKFRDDEEHPNIQEDNIDFYIKNNEGSSLLRSLGNLDENLHLNKTRKFSNIVVLLQTFSHLNCYEWGLRPELTRFAIPRRIRKEPTTLDTIFLLNWFNFNGDYVQHITNSLFSACGDISSIESLQRFEYEGKLRHGNDINYDIYSPYIVNNYESVTNEIIRVFKGDR